MKKIVIGLIFSSMLILCACPLITQNSIDNGSYGIPHWLCGKWTEIKDSGDVYQMEIQALRGKKGQGISYELDSAGNRKGAPTALIMSKIGRTIFWNVYMPSKKGDVGGWMIYKYEKTSGNSFKLISVKEKMVDYKASQKALKNFFTKYKDVDSIYDPSSAIEYRKMK